MYCLQMIIIVKTLILVSIHVKWVCVMSEVLWYMTFQGGEQGTVFIFNPIYPVLASVN